MKTFRNKYFYLVVLSVLFAFAFVLGAAGLKTKNNVHAYRDVLSELNSGNEFFMQGASIRLDNAQGIRFRAVASKAFAEEVINDENKSFGAFIFPLDWMRYFDLPCDTFDEEYDYLAEIKNSYAEVGKVSEIENIQPAAVIENGEVAYYEIRATISNVRYQNLPRTFFGMAYVKTTSEGGDSYRYAKFDDANKRSAAYVSSAALTEDASDFTDSDKAALYDYMQLSLYALNGVSESEARANVSAGTYYDYQISLNKTEIQLSVDETFDIMPILSCKTGESDVMRLAENPFYVKYVVTEGDDVIGLDGNTVTAKKTGSATVTAYYAAKGSEGFVNKSVSLAVSVGGVSYQNLLSAKTQDVGSGATATIENNVLTASGISNGNGEYQYIGFQIKNMEGQTQISFTVKNTDSAEMNALVWVATENSNTYSNSIKISSAVNATTGGTKDGATFTVGGNEGKTISITLSSPMHEKGQIRIAHTRSDSMKSFTVSDVYFGEGSADSRYSVNLAETSDGSVSTDCVKALAGQTVYITAVADKGYAVGSVSVTDKSGNSVSVTDNAFVMPESDVTVAVSFAKKTYALTVSDGVSAAFERNGERVTTAQIGDSITVVSTLDGATVTGFAYKSMSRSHAVSGDSFTMGYDRVVLTSVTVTYAKTISVIGGVAKNGSGETVTEAETGDTVTIVANSPETGYRFIDWTVNAGDVVLVDATASSTTFTVGSANVVVTAGYALIDYEITNEDGSAAQVQVGGQVALTAHYGQEITVMTLKGEGWIVDGFTYRVDDGEEQYCDGATLSMPAGNLIILSVTQHQEIVYATISAAGRWENDVPSATLSNNNKTVTVTANRGSGDSGQHGHNAYATITNSASNQQQISFYLSASSSVTVYIALLSNINQYAYNNGNLVALESCTIDGVAATKVSEKEAYKIPLSAKPVEIVIVTSATFSLNPTVGFWPFMESGFNGTIVAEKFLVSAAIPKYTVTVNGGTANPAKQAEGETVTITANAPATGYAFTGWTVVSGGVTLSHLSTETATFIMGTENVEIKANYALIAYNVSNLADGAATLNVNGGASETANYGDTITLTANEAGKIVASFTYTVSGGAEQTNNGSGMLMPAGDLVITGVTVEDASTPHTVTVNYGSANVSEASEGETVTITANDPETGYVFLKWISDDGVVFADASKSVTTFTMLGSDVTVTATYEKTVSYATIAESMTNGNFAVTLAEDGKSLTVSSTQDWIGSYDGAYLSVSTGEASVTKVTFTITNTSNQSLSLGVCAQQKYEKYTTRYTPSGATCGGSSFVSGSDGDYGVKLNAISKGESKTITFTFSGNIVQSGYVYFKLAPYEKFNGGTFTISEIYFG
ncbi:MAG: hypothetical protein ACI4NG_03930 [Candidatus Gallimonas sp.]